MLQKRRSASKPRRRRRVSAPDHQLSFAFPEPIRPAADDEKELLAAALKRVRVRSTEWDPPLPEFTPMMLFAWCMAKTGREWNDPALERAGMLGMGYRLN